MKKQFQFLILLLIAVTILSGCNLFTPKPETPKQTEITYFASAENTDKFCNGADMDSEGYRQTITQQKTEMLAKNNLSLKQRVLETLTGAVNFSGLPISNNITDSYFKIIGDTAYIQPIEGWAGVSIFLCYWKPFIEINLLQFPEINEVEWVTDELIWNELAE